MTIYYHGGPDGLHVGQYIRPADETGAKTYGKQIAKAKGLEGTVRTDRVYLTTVLAAALLFAGGFKRPMVYECVPDGDVENDPDYRGPAGESVSCPRARIVRRHPMRPSEIQTVRQVLLREL